VADARAALERIPVHAPQNLTLLDRSGEFMTAYVGPGRPPSFHAVAATTNHQGKVEWPEYAAAIRSEEREQRVIELLADPDMTAERFVAAFLEPPLRSTQYAAGFGTLYTAAYHPVDGRAEFSWPGASWELSLTRATSSETDHDRVAIWWLLHRWCDARIARRRRRASDARRLHAHAGIHQGVDARPWVPAGRRGASKP